MTDIHARIAAVARQVARRHDEPVFGALTGNATTCSAAEQPPLTLDRLREMRDRMGAPPPSLQLAPSLVADIERKVDFAPNPMLVPPLGSMPYRSSALFPFEVECRDCEGTGDGGAEATYCRTCGGVGKLNVVGAATDSNRATIITDKLRGRPKRFAPSFPAGLVPPRPMSRGLA